MSYIRSIHKITNNLIKLQTILHAAKKQVIKQIPNQVNPKIEKKTPKIEP